MDAGVAVVPGEAFDGNERPSTTSDPVNCNQNCNHASRPSVVIDGTGSGLSRRRRAPPSPQLLVDQMMPGRRSHRPPQAPIMVSLRAASGRDIRSPV
jgi:hypothetical protein